MRLENVIRIFFYILLFFGGFYLGRTSHGDALVEFTEGESIRDTIAVPAPEKEETPVLPKMPIKRDTIYIDNIQLITEKVDTAEIIKDYVTQRTYEFNVFKSDTLGKFDVKQKIGYNKLLSFDYTFTPMTKQITRYKEPLLTPFISIGYSTNRSVLLGGGLYYRHVGLEYNMNISTMQQWEIRGLPNTNYHTFKLNYKF